MEENEEFEADEEFARLAKSLQKALSKADAEEMDAEADKVFVDLMTRLMKGDK